MAQAIALGLMIVLTYALISRVGLRREFVDLPLLVAAVIGIGAMVGRTCGDRPFLKAAVIAFITALGVESLASTTGNPWGQPEILPNEGFIPVLLVAVSLMIGAIAGAVALGVRRLRARTDSRR